jgi:hypothetical protein
MTWLKALAVVVLFAGVGLSWLDLRGYLRDPDRTALLGELQRWNSSDQPLRVSAEHPGARKLLAVHPPPAGRRVQDVVAISRSGYARITPSAVPIAEGNVSYHFSDDSRLDVLTFGALREWCNESPYDWLAWWVTLTGAILAAAGLVVDAWRTRSAIRA